MKQTGYNVLVTLTSEVDAGYIEDLCDDIRDVHFTNVNEIIFVGGSEPVKSDKYKHYAFTIPEKRQSLEKNKLDMIYISNYIKELKNGFLWIEQGANLRNIRGLEIHKKIHYPNHADIKIKGHGMITHKRTRSLMKRRGFNNYVDLFNKNPIFIETKKLSIIDDIDFISGYGICIKTVYFNYNRL